MCRVVAHNMCAVHHNESEPVEPHLDVELLELLQVEPAGGTVLQESLVPLLQLVLVKLRVLHQILHHFRGQLAVLFPHFSCDKQSTKRGRGTQHL